MVKKNDFAIILLQLTSRCPNRCRHCYNCSGPEMDSDQLSFGEIRDLYRILMKKYKKVVFTLSGGEPTLRSDLSDIIEFLGRNRNVKLVIHSQNSRLVDYKELIKRYNITGNISVNGMPETHNMIMGRDNAWEDAQKLIEEFHWPIRILVHREILDEAKDIAKMLSEFGYGSADAGKPVRCGRGKDLILPTNEEFWHFIDVMGKNRIWIQKEKISLQDTKLCPIYEGLYGNYDIFDISSKGDVSCYCCYGINSSLFRAGNIRKDSWDKISSFENKFNYDVVKKKFGDVVLSHTMDACNLCTQCWDNDLENKTEKNKEQEAVCLEIPWHKEVIYRMKQFLMIK